MPNFALPGEDGYLGDEYDECDERRVAELEKRQQLTRENALLVKRVAELENRLNGDSQDFEIKCLRETEKILRTRVAELEELARCGWDTARCLAIACNASSTEAIADQTLFSLGESHALKRRAVMSGAVAEGEVQARKQEEREIWSREAGRREMVAAKLRKERDEAREIALRWMWIEIPRGPADPQWEADTKVAKTWPQYEE